MYECVSLVRLSGFAISSPRELNEWLIRSAISVSVTLLPGCSNIEHLESFISSGEIKFLLTFASNVLH
jgi:hypothetical protein